MAITENSFIKRLKSSGRSLVVFYGSQTGTGEEFAGRLAKEGIRYHMKGMVADPEECDMVRFSVILQCCVCATFFLFFFRLTFSIAFTIQKYKLILRFKLIFLLVFATKSLNIQ